jgi:hypothetical protein
MKGNPLTFVIQLSKLATVTSDATGTVTCQQTFSAWHAKDNAGTVRYCPLTAAEKTAGVHCAIALFDKPTKGKTSDALARFTTG